LSALPSLSHHQLEKVLQDAGFEMAKHRGSHVRLQKRVRERLVRVTVPSRAPLKKTTLARIIRDAGLSLEEFSH